MTRGTRPAVFIASLVLFVLVTASCGLQSNMELVYKWKSPNWVWKSEEQREAALRSGAYDPEGAVPLGLNVAGDRLILSTGSYPGSPAILGTVPRTPQGTESPLLSPYPSWSWQYPITNSTKDCGRTLVNALRTTVDSCGRLWVPDVGVFRTRSHNVSLPGQCPAKIIVFDLSTDKAIRTYILPSDQYTVTSLFTTITVDTSSGCDDAYAYVSDTKGETIITYSWRRDTSWIFRNTRFATAPVNDSRSQVFVAGSQVTVQDGIYQVVLPSRKYPPLTGKDTAFWHTLTSYQENMVHLSLLRDPASAERPNNPLFRKLGERGSELGQQVVGAVSEGGTMLYTLAGRDALACWNTARPYGTQSQAVVSQATPGTFYPSGLTIVPSLQDPQQEEVWLLSTGLARQLFEPMYPSIGLKPGEDKLVIHRALVRDLIKNTICT